MSTTSEITPRQSVSDTNSAISTISTGTTYDLLRSFDDYEPVFGKKYFIKDATPPKGFDKINILIPMYNETSNELKRTLGDLHECILKMNKIGGGYVHTLVILDGWRVTHSSMKEYLKEMYPSVSDKIDNIGESGKDVETYILQKIKNNESTFVKISEDQKMKLSFIIKVDNRRKHNSHAWFLESFAQEMMSDYVFLTDCGTRFDPKCLVNLYRNIITDPDCSAISGRQRVMSEEQQGSDDDLRGLIYRAVQCFDYEASLASFVGAFSTFGMLPVIPGPCGLYRFDAICDKERRANMYKDMLPRIKTTKIQEIQNESSSVPSSPSKATLSPRKTQRNNETINVEKNDVVIEVAHPPLKEGEYIDAIDFYVKTVSLNPDETGMLLGSLLLAEDRILSYAAVLQTKKQYHTKYEPSSTFYFEAEVNPTQLLQQRRRWINGTMAGYLWLFQNIGLLFKSKMLFYQKIFLTMLLFSQLMMFCIMAIGVSILTIAIRYPLVSIIQLPRVYAEICVGTFMLLYIVFVWFHSSPVAKRPKLNVLLFDIITIANMAIAIIMLVSVIISILKFKVEFAILFNIGIICFNTLMPFFLAALHDWKSLGLMIKTFIPFLLLLPTFTVFFSVYAFSRMWELTWGNRPSDRLTTITQRKTQEELQEIKQNLQNNARTFAWGLVVLNVIVCIVFSSIQFDTRFVLGLQCFIFFWSSFQMIISFLYFIITGIYNFLAVLGRFILTGSCTHKKMDLRRKFGTKNKTHKAIISSIDLEMRVVNL